jgi:hypothetical protein
VRSAFTIRNLRDAYDCDLDMNDTIGGIFESEADPTKRLIKVVPALIYRDVTLPASSTLRPASAQQKRLGHVSTADANKRRRIGGGSPKLDQPLPSIELGQRGDELHNRVARCSRSSSSLMPFRSNQTGGAEYVAIKEERESSIELGEPAPHDVTQVDFENAVVEDADPLDDSLGVGSDTVHLAPPVHTQDDPSSRKKDIWEISSSPDGLHPPTKHLTTYGRSPRNRFTLPHKSSHITGKLSTLARPSQHPKTSGVESAPNSVKQKRTLLRSKQSKPDGATMASTNIRASEEQVPTPSSTTALEMVKASTQQVSSPTSSFKWINVLGGPQPPNTERKYTRKGTASKRNLTTRKAKTPLSSHPPITSMLIEDVAREPLVPSSVQANPFQYWTAPNANKKAPDSVVLESAPAQLDNRSSGYVQNEQTPDLLPRDVGQRYKFASSSVNATQTTPLQSSTGETTAQPLVLSSGVSSAAMSLTSSEQDKETQDDYLASPTIGHSDEERARSKYFKAAPKADDQSVTIDDAAPERVVSTESSITSERSHIEPLPSGTRDWGFDNMDQGKEVTEMENRESIERTGETAIAATTSSRSASISPAATGLGAIGVGPEGGDRSRSGSAYHTISARSSFGTSRSPARFLSHSPTPEKPSSEDESSPSPPVSEKALVDVEAESGIDNDDGNSTRSTESEGEDKNVKTADVFSHASAAVEKKPLLPPPPSSLSQPSKRRNVNAARPGRLLMPSDSQPYPRQAEFSPPSLKANKYSASQPTLSSGNQASQSPLTTRIPPVRRKASHYPALKHYVDAACSVPPSPHVSKIFDPRLHSLRRSAKRKGKKDGVLDLSNSSSNESSSESSNSDSDG